MPSRPYNLAIETSDVQGWITLGRDHELLEAVGVNPTRTRDASLSPRTGGELMPAIDALCQRHHVQPAQLGQVYVATGPGSFTGLRVAMATVQMLARFLDVRVVAVPSTRVIAQQVPWQAGQPAHLAVALNLKRQTGYVERFERQGDLWKPIGGAAVTAIDKLLATCPRPMLLAAPALPADHALPDGVTRVPAQACQPHSDSVWLLGRRAAMLGQYTDPAAILPLYARPPEAVELWNQRHGQAS